MDEIEIPLVWREAVCAILESHDCRRIAVVKRAQDEWFAAFPDAFPYELYNALADALTGELVMGKRVLGMFPPGEVYAFWFFFRGQRLYGKINLVDGGLEIVVYSAHRPLKGDEL